MTQTPLLTVVYTSNLEHNMQMLLFMQSALPLHFYFYAEESEHNC